MTSLQEAVENGGVYRFEGSGGAPLSRLSGRPPRHVRIEKPPTKLALLETLAAVLGFPDHFGANWDALYDSLTDLPLVPGSTLVIEVGGLSRLARQAAGDLTTAIDTFRDAAAFWRERDVRLVVLLGGTGRPGRDLTEVA
jgi:RNAse (barnase) inhibitor barstar